jgi:phosphoribosyl 1,2-cyclic phosphodiesterase
MTTHLTVEKLRRCQAVVLEFNHDLKMLMEGPYPWWLKQRVRGRLGHLDNTEALGVLERIVDGGVQAALLGHLSQENNDPSLVRALALERLAHNGQEHARVTVLDQDVPGPVIRIVSDVTVEHDAVEENSR